MRGCAALLLLLVALTSCGSFSFFNDPAIRDEYPNIPALEQIVVSYSDELERYNKLFLSDSRAYYDHYIEMVCMKFRTQEIMDVLAGRDLIVHVVEGFLARVNESPWTSGDLYSYPFTAQNLMIEIEFDSFYGKYVDRRELAQIHLKDGIVYYYANDAMDPDTVWFHKRQEPYDKAYRFSKFKHYRPWIKIPPPPDWTMHDATPTPAQKGQRPVAPKYIIRSQIRQEYGPQQPENLLYSPTNVIVPSNTRGVYNNYPDRTGLDATRIRDNALPPL